MERLFELYNNLFAIEVAAFGIVSAVIFVFVQLVHSTFSYRNISFLLKDWWLRLYGTSSVLGLVLTASGSFFLAFDNHDIIPSLDLKIDLWISSPYYAAFVIFLFGISLVMLLLFVRRNLPYLTPSRVLLLYSREVNYKGVRDFLFKKFGVTRPDQYGFLEWALETGRGHARPTEEETTRAKKEYKRRVRRSERIEQGVKDVADPLAPVTELVINLIKRSDLKSLGESKDLICKVSRDALRGVPKEIDQWHPEQDIPKKYTNYLIEHIKTQLEICSNERLDSASRAVLDPSACLAESLLENTYFTELEELAEFWKRTAVESIGKSPQIFIHIVGYYRQSLDKLFKLLGSGGEEVKPIERCIDAMFQDLGLLSEEIILKLPLEERSWFPDYDYTSEFDSLFNCLMQYDYEYNKQPKLYPLIYFDALQVTLLKLARLPAKDHDKLGVKDAIYSILATYSSFAERALENNNSAGANWAAIKISEAHREFRNLGLGELKKYATQLIVRVGADYAKNKSKITEKASLGDLDDWAIKELVENRHDTAAIQEEVTDNFLRVGIDYIKRLGKPLGTNFGLMFDPQTGETYPEDDPRRR